MPNSININSNFIKGVNNKAQATVKYTKEQNMKISGVEQKSATKDNSTDTILSLSKESRLKSANQSNTSKHVKKAGVTSARELFENDSAELKREARGERGNVGPDFIEMMRLEDPVRYAKWEALWEKCEECGGWDTKEGFDYFLQTGQTTWEFICIYTERRNDLDKSIAAEYGVLDTLDRMYSDATHDTSFNFYGLDSLDSKSSLWRFNSKFNVLLSVDMLKSLGRMGNLDKNSAEEKNKIQGILDKIDRSVNAMKKVEKKYEGNLEYLRFGVKLWDNGNVTYHANYKGCENADGIVSDSADDLLKKLMSA